MTIPTQSPLRALAERLKELHGEFLERAVTAKALGGYLEGGYGTAARANAATYRECARLLAVLIE